MRPLQTGRVVPYPDTFAFDDMCVPVSPNTSHPLSRTAVELTKHLPSGWHPCYHPTCMDLHFRAPAGDVDYSGATEVTLDGMMTTDRYVQEDDIRRGEMWRSNEPSASNESFSPMTADQLDHDDYSVLEDLIYLSRIAPSENGHHKDPEITSTPIWLTDDGVNFITAHADEDDMFTPVIRYTPDLTGIESLESGYQLQVDVTELERWLSIVLFRTLSLTRRRILNHCRIGPPIESSTTSARGETTSLKSKHCKLF